MIYRPINTTGGELFENVGLAIVCPVCLGDYVSTDGDAHIDDWMGRGGARIQSMVCEGGHLFEIGIGFHKGQSWIFTRHEPAVTQEPAHTDANGHGGWQ